MTEPQKQPLSLPPSIERQEVAAIAAASNHRYIQLPHCV